MPLMLEAVINHVVGNNYENRCLYNNAIMNNNATMTLERDVRNRTLALC
jgi:hypothetical protein